MAVSVIPTMILVNSVPEQIPADVIVQEQDRQARIAAGEGSKEAGDEDVNEIHAKV